MARTCYDLPHFLTTWMTIKQITIRYYNGTSASKRQASFYIFKYIKIRLTVDLEVKIENN